METIAEILMLVGTVGFWTTVVGLIKPAWLKLSSRKEVLQAMLGSFIILIVAVVLMPTPPEGDKQPSQIAAETQPPAPSTTNPESDQTAISSAETSETKPAAQPKEKEAKPVPTIDMTAAQFEQRINEILKEADAGHIEKKGEQNEGAKGRYLQQYVMPGKNVSYLLETEGKEGKTTSLLMMAGGSKEDPMGAVADVLISSAGALGAVDPSLEKEDRGEILFDKLKMSEAKMDDGVERETVVNGIKYSLSLGSVTGFWLTVTPAE